MRPDGHLHKLTWHEPKLIYLLAAAVVLTTSAFFRVDSTVVAGWVNGVGVAALVGLLWTTIALRGGRP